MGECQNAVVAHEIAVQFKNMGIEVPLLIVIDENWRARSRDSEHPMKQTFFRKQITELKANGIEYFYSKLKKRWRLGWHKTISSLDRLREKWHIIAGLPVPESIQYRTMEKIYYMACEKSPYSPPRYSGQVLLLYSKGWEKQFRPQLSQCYTGVIHRESLPISHSDWFKPKQIRFILKEILQYA